MNMVAIARTFLTLCAAVAASAVFAATGESWKSTGTLTKGKTKTVTLVAEKNLYWESGDDPDTKYDNNGAYYAKITCRKTTTTTPVVLKTSRSNATTMAPTATTCSRTGILTTLPHARSSFTFQVKSATR